MASTITRYATPADDLQLLLDNAPPGATIHLSEGVWRQKLILRTPGLQLQGAGQDRTRIVYDDAARRRHPDGREYNTFRTWTVAVTAPDIHMSDLWIENDALRPEEKGQEVALSVYGDHFVMARCRLTSTQDTLFVGPLPQDLCTRYIPLLPQELRRREPLQQCFHQCLIEGTVDFIFGCGEALFEDCEIRSLYDCRGIGYCAAPAHAPSQTSGLTFRGCRFTCDSRVPPESVYLARPWRDAGLAMFDDCSYGPHISPAGFDPWGDTHRDQTARFYERPAVPGRVPWVRAFTDDRTGSV